MSEGETSNKRRREISSFQICLCFPLNFSPNPLSLGLVAFYVLSKLLQVLQLWQPPSWQFFSLSVFLLSRGQAPHLSRSALDRSARHDADLVVDAHQMSDEWGQVSSHVARGRTQWQQGGGDGMDSEHVLLGSTSLRTGPTGSPGSAQWHPRQVGHCLTRWHLWFRKASGTGLEIWGASTRAMILPEGTLLIPFLCRALNHKVGQGTWCLAPSWWAWVANCCSFRYLGRLEVGMGVGRGHVPSSLSSYSATASPLLRPFGSKWGTSLGVQWLRLCAPNEGGQGSVPGQGTRACMLQLKRCVSQKRLKILCAAMKTSSEK